MELRQHHSSTSNPVLPCRGDGEGVVELAMVWAMEREVIGHTQRAGKLGPPVLMSLYAVCRDGLFDRKLSLRGKWRTKTKPALAVPSCHGI